MNEKNLNKKTQEQQVEQKFLNSFNSITEKSTTENQNQQHNIKKEGTTPVNQRR